MTRKEFIKLSSLLGLSIPLQPNINALINGSLQNNKKVLIIGAGAAGMTAGYLLAQNDIDFQIIEASSTYGGRIKHDNTFASFPISLGGEWIHSSRNTLKQAVNNDNITLDIITKAYSSSDTYGYFDGKDLTIGELGSDVGHDLKFIDSSWLDFFELYILPKINNNIIYNTPITKVNYTNNDLLVSTKNGEIFKGHNVIITVPVKILQQNSVTFTPNLSTEKQNALNKLSVWSGFKSFIQFESKFYPTFLEFNDSATKTGQRLYYDAAYGQKTKENVLGLFSVGKQAEIYQQFDHKNLRDYILDELDSVFGAQLASRNFLKFTYQNWNKEPFIGGAYVADHENWRYVRNLGKSIDDKLYFAGCSYTNGEDWGSVHTAIESARQVVQELIAN